MAQGAELDLVDISFFTEDRAVYYINDNVTFQEINTNVLTVDNKAILARNTAQTVTADLAAHIGSVGLPVHAGATTASSGFMSATDKLKLNNIATGAKVGILSPADALELTTRKDTFLHLHPAATTAANGFMSAVDKVKLDTVQTGAQANRLNDANALTLTDGSNADSLHTHFFGLITETFTATVHNSISHAGIPGTAGFTPFTTTESYFPGPLIDNSTGTTIQIFSHTYPFLPEVLSGDWRYLHTTGFNSKDTALTTGFAISGNDGIITYSAEDTNAGGTDILTLSCWQGAYGITP
jgi:hypothetical protein